MCAGVPMIITNGVGRLSQLCKWVPHAMDSQLPAIHAVITQAISALSESDRGNKHSSPHRPDQRQARDQA